MSRLWKCGAAKVRKALSGFTRAGLGKYFIPFVKFVGVGSVWRTSVVADHVLAVGPLAATGRDGPELRRVPVAAAPQPLHPVPAVVVVVALTRHVVHPLVDNRLVHEFAKHLRRRFIVQVSRVHHEVGAVVLQGADDGARSGIKAAVIALEGVARVAVYLVHRALSISVEVHPVVTRVIVSYARVADKAYAHGSCGGGGQGQECQGQAEHER